MVYTYSGTLAFKKKEILPVLMTWMQLEDIMLSEISQTEKDEYCMISLMCVIFFIKSPTHSNRVEWWLPKDGAS